MTTIDKIFNVLDELSQLTEFGEFDGDNFKMPNHSISVSDLVNFDMEKMSNFEKIEKDFITIVLKKLEKDKVDVDDSHIIMYDFPKHGFGLGTADEKTDYTYLESDDVIDVCTNDELDRFQKFVREPASFAQRALLTFIHLYDRIPNTLSRAYEKYDMYLADHDCCGDGGIPLAIFREIFRRVLFVVENPFTTKNLILQYNFDRLAELITKNVDFWECTDLAYAILHVKFNVPFPECNKYDTS